jgi:hypothetical protein
MIASLTDDTPIYIDGRRVRFFDCDRCGTEYDQLGRRATKYCMPCAKAIKNKGNARNMAAVRSFVREVKADPDTYLDTDWLDSRGLAFDVTDSTEWLMGSLRDHSIARVHETYNRPTNRPMSLDLNDDEIYGLHYFVPTLKYQATPRGPIANERVSRTTRHALGVLSKADLKTMHEAAIFVVVEAGAWWAAHPDWATRLNERDLIASYEHVASCLYGDGYSQIKSGRCRLTFL